jgi:hypothetical protein
MDASDTGLCVLYPAAREFVRVKFDEEERADILRGEAGFSINVRETLSVAFAAVVWGPQWKFLAQHDPIHVRCWIDNASAVAWVDRHFSKNATGQELIRVVSCAEVQYKIHFSTTHLAGSANIMADQGSRAWSGGLLTQWTNDMTTWSEQAVPAEFRKIYKQRLSRSSGSHSPTRPAESTSIPGASGASSAHGTASTDGYQSTIHSPNPYSSLCSRFAAGAQTSQQRLFDLKPYALSSATLHGVINLPAVSGHNSCPSTNSRSTACSGSALHNADEEPSARVCSRSSPAHSTSQSPNTASFVGLRCWASSFV